MREETSLIAAISQAALIHVQSVPVMRCEAGGMPLHMEGHILVQCVSYLVAHLP